MLDLSNKAFNQFQHGIKALNGISHIYYSKEEIDSVYALYRESKRLKNRVIAVGEAEKDRIRWIFTLSVKGNTFIEKILKRTL